MTLDTNISRNPYFDDFNPKAGYYKILFKPRVATQVRELNQIQSTFQDQIDKFGRSIYKEGSIVEGCTFAFDNKRQYIKVSDNFTNGSTYTIDDYLNQYVVNDNGLKAKIVYVTSGFESQAPNTNTIYVKYVNGATFSNGSPQTVFSPNDTLSIVSSANLSLGEINVLSNTHNANVGVPVGTGYMMSVTEGVVFKKGTFLYVQPQSVLVTPYSSYPDGLSVGFNADESIITAAANNALYDNAAGYPNYSAPGADRLKISPSLVVRDSADVTNSASFFSIADFKGGFPITAKQTAQYSSLGDEMARRTYETNGDFVVAPFVLSTQIKNVTQDEDYNTHVNLRVSKGIGYPKGYRVEYLNNNVVSLRKGMDFVSAAGQSITTNFGYYISASDFAGEFGDSSRVVQVELHNTAKNAVSSGALLGVNYSSATKIGNAYVRGFMYDQGTPGTANAEYVVYLFGVTMDAGANFADVRSLIYRDSGANKGVADVVTTINARGANTAVINQPNLGSMLFAFGQNALKPDGFDNTEFTYRRKGTTQILVDGTASLTVPAAAGTGSEQFAYIGTLSSAQKQRIYVVPTSAGQSANLTGNVAITSGANAVTGTGTAFLSEYRVGDYITVNGDDGLIDTIANNTYLRCAYNFTTSNANSRHAKSFPVGQPIPISNRNGRTIVCTTSTATLNLGETISGAFNVDMFYDVRRYDTVPVRKVVQRDVVVKINCATNNGGKTGPWSLGIPDVIAVKKIYISSAAYATSGTDRSSYFELDNGQRDAYYGLASINLKSTAPANLIRSTSKITVVVDCFTHDQSAGRGFFSANSYPIDDANTANTNAITTQEIPLYLSESGRVYDLRDVVDFRVIAANTAAVTNSAASATENPASTVSFSVYPYLPSPDSTFETDIQYYLSRRDRIVLDTNGVVKVLEGKPRVSKPIAPDERKGTMTLGFASVPPYPSLSVDVARTYNRYDYAIQTEVSQNRRYTMKDIGTLESRIETLEYYTSLSLLEKSTADLQVRSSTTGQNRFQNGLFVQPFKGFDLSDVKNTQYMAAIDGSRTEMRPAIMRESILMAVDTARSTGIKKAGDLVLLDYTSNNVYISQPYASKKRNCVEGNVYTWKGVLTLYPSVSTLVDTTIGPTVVNNIDLASNWLVADKAWNMSWGDWIDTSTKISSTKNGEQTYTGNVIDVDGSVDYKYEQTTTYYTKTTQQRTGYDLDISSNTTKYELGTFVTDVSVLPYLKPATIRFKITGMKPNTRLYAYFGETSVTNYVQLTNSDWTEYLNGTDWTAPLLTNDQGCMWGVFNMPANIFKSEEIVFRMCDVDDLTIGEKTIQTSASATYYGSKLSMKKSSSELNIRDAVVNLEEEMEIRTIEGSYSNTTIHIVDNPPPQYCNCWACDSFGTGQCRGGGEGACGDSSGGGYGRW